MSLTICMVAFGVGKVNGSYVGGHVNNLVTVSKRLAERGNQVHIVTTPPIHEAVDEDSPSIHESVTVHVEAVDETTSTEVSMNGRRSVLYGLRSARRLIPKISYLNDRYNFDVIHSHSGFPGVGLIPTTVRPLTNTPAVHTLYCPVPATVKSRLVSLTCLRSLECVIGISDNVTESIRLNYLNTHVQTIPPLVDTERYTPCSDYERDERLKVLFVGNFSKSKGIDVLLEALSELNDRGWDIELLFAFDMPVERYQREQLPIKDQIQSLGLSDVVTPLGIVDDLPGKMQEADIFVAPFRDTQGPADYPLTMLEAMAAGLTVIASDVGGIPEVIDEGSNGLLVRPDDSNALVAAIRELAEDPDKRDFLGTNALGDIEELNRQVVLDHEKMYRDVINNG